MIMGSYGIIPIGGSTIGIVGGFRGGGIGGSVGGEGLKIKGGSGQNGTLKGGNAGRFGSSPATFGDIAGT
jgi:hypothetical protein